MVNTIRIAFVVLALCLSTGDRIASAGKAAPVATKSSAKSAKMAPTPAPSAKTSPATNRLAGLIKGRRGKGAPEPRKAASKAQRADGAAKTASRASQEPSTLRLLTLEGPRLTYRAIKSHPRLFARGVFLDGPKHAYKAIARHKKAFFGGMAAVASPSTSISSRRSSPSASRSSESRPATPSATSTARVSPVPTPHG